MTGNEYKKLVGRYLASAYAKRGLQVYDEVYLGTSIIGKQRRIDLFVVGPEEQALCVECKYQDSSGTADEKIPYAINDMTSQRIPGVIVYAGAGFSAGVLHLLQGSEYAAYCLPDALDPKPIPRSAGAMNAGTWQLDHVVAQTFRFWDIVIAGKRPISAERPIGAEQPIRPERAEVPHFELTCLEAATSKPATATAKAVAIADALFNASVVTPSPAPGPARRGK